MDNKRHSHSNYNGGRDDKIVLAAIIGCPVALFILAVLSAMTN